MLVNCLTWLFLGILIVTNAHPSLPDQPVIKWLMASSSFVITCILLVLSLMIYRRNKIGYTLTLAALVITALLTFFDDFGLSDLIVLIVISIPVIFLIKDRAWYFQVTHG
jgi:hypothetical protein